MWQRPSIIPPIEDVKHLSLHCGCAATIINGTDFDTFLLFSRYKVPLEELAKISWCAKQCDFCATSSYGAVKLFKLYNGLKYGSVESDPVKSMLIFTFLNKAQLK